MTKFIFKTQVNFLDYGNLLEDNLKSGTTEVEWEITLQHTSSTLIITDINLLTKSVEVNVEFFDKDGNDCEETNTYNIEQCVINTVLGEYPNLVGLNIKPVELMLCKGKFELILSY